MNRWLTVGCAGTALAFVLVGGAAVETASGVGAAFPAAMQETTSSTLDGVFTSAQARRGRRVYNQNCASCHGQGLRGDEMAPSVAGSDFIVFWTELPVGALFNRIKLTMPEDGPGRLSDQEYTDVVAYMLDRNDYPAGENELSTDKAELDRIMIVAAE
jgi:mono/diheme cytochrome c family protein